MERFTLLKSVHIFKKHRVQYEMRTHYRCLEVMSLNLAIHICLIQLVTDGHKYLFKINSLVSPFASKEYFCYISLPVVCIDLRCLLFCSCLI